MSHSNARSRYWAVVPAAGKGSRFGSEIPKQYLKLAGTTVLEHTLGRLTGHPEIAAVVVATSSDDDYWSTMPFVHDQRIIGARGGAERCHSVLNALETLTEHADADDWVLVHDAARPCLRHADIDRLIRELHDHPVGGLLGIPVADTLKRCDNDQTVRETVSREGLWRALTPQMFRVGALTRALRRAIDDDHFVTDEAAAMEYLGHRPRMVSGHADNIKITHPQDLALAELYLVQQEKERP